MSEDERVANARSAAAGERESARPSKGASADAGAPSAGDGKVEAKRAKEPMSVSRRSLLIGAGGTAVLFGLGALRYAGHNPLVRPPGGPGRVPPGERVRPLRAGATRRARDA